MSCHAVVSILIALRAEAQRIIRGAAVRQLRHSLCRMYKGKVGAVLETWYSKMVDDAARAEEMRLAGQAHAYAGGAEGMMRLAGHMRVQMPGCDV